MKKKTKKKPRNKKVKIDEFDSEQERQLYNHLLTFIDKDKIETHKSFTILNEIPDYGLRNKVYTPDFVITINDKVLVIEVKAVIIKKFQRDFQLRYHLFVEKYTKPNGWTYIFVNAEDIANNTIEIFTKINNIITKIIKGEGDVLYNIQLKIDDEGNKELSIQSYKYKENKKVYLLETGKKIKKEDMDVVKTIEKKGIVTVNVWSLKERDDVLNMVINEVVNIFEEKIQHAKKLIDIVKDLNKGE